MSIPITALLSAFPYLSLARGPIQGGIQLLSDTYHQIPLHLNQIQIEKSASDIVTAMLSAKNAGPSYDSTIASLAQQAGGWSEYLALKTLSTLESALNLGTKMSPAMKIAYDKACEEVKAIEEFAAEHPFVTAVIVTIIALGILVIFAPSVLEALGFAKLGPVEGSFAAKWMSRYRGFVSKRSLYSYLQRLGMKWKPLQHL